MPTGGTVFISVRDVDKPGVVVVGKELSSLGFSLVATRGTAAVLAEAGLEVAEVIKVQEGRPHIVDLIRSDQIDLYVITIECRQASTDTVKTSRRPGNQHASY